MNQPLIRSEWPPNIKAIRAVLPVTERNVFAWAGIIYAPGGGWLGPALIAHERVHFEQQGRNPVRWWKKYLKDPEFRLAQEIPAHMAEYAEFCRLNRDRNAQSRFLHVLGKRLSAPMYGGLITAADARKQIRE